jgi:hypothetical protein
MQRAFLSLLTLLFAVCTFGHSAEAGPTLSTFGAGCVPADAAIQGNRYLIQSGKVTNTSTNTALVTLYCPVLAIPGTADPGTMCLTYQDTSGTVTTSFVDAQVWSMSKTTVRSRAEH